MKTATTLAALIILGSASLGFAQSTTRPSARPAPTTQELADNVKSAQAALDAANAALKQAQADAPVRLTKDPEYQKLLAAVSDANAKLTLIQSIDTTTGKSRVTDATFQKLLDAVSAAAAKKAAIREPDTDSPQDRLDAAQARVDAAAELSKAQSDADKYKKNVVAEGSASLAKAQTDADDYKAGFAAKDQSVVSATKAQADAADRLRSAQAAVTRAEADAAAEAAARGREEASREGAATIEAATPDELKQATDGGGKVSGAAWTVKNDGTSSLMRGLPVFIVERDTRDVPAVIGVLKTEIDGWQKLADLTNKEADDDRKRADESGFAELAKFDRESADREAADAARYVATVKAIQDTIDSLSGMKTIDRKHALDLEADKKLIVGGAPSGAMYGFGKTDVDGKFVIDKVLPGDYYLISDFASATLIIEWIIPVHVDAGGETKIDLDNDNAAYIKQAK